MHCVLILIALLTQVTPMSLGCSTFDVKIKLHNFKSNLSAEINSIIPTYFKMGDKCNLAD